MNNNINTIPVQQMYKQRKEFIIVALTGITGSGCSDLAKLMCLNFDEWSDNIRSVKSIENLFYGEKQDVVFYRKYELCHNVCKTQYEPFSLIKYRNVLLLCALEYYVRIVDTYEDLVTRIHDLIKQKFDKSREIKDDLNNKQYIVDNYLSTDKIMGLGLSNNLYVQLKNAQGELIKGNKQKYRSLLFDFFENEAFQNFCEDIYKELKLRDYYAKNFFVHRLAVALRATNNPDYIVKSCDDFSNENIFIVAEKINDIIKGAHDKDETKDRRFVIDSLKNSMEMLYLKERYTAFYTVAVHNDGYEKEMILRKVCKTLYNKDFSVLSENDKNKAEDITERMWQLNNKEQDKRDFEAGRFYGPDISRCVTESEIHISYKKWKEEDVKEKQQERSFYSFGEQWMKFYSLIIRPGLITPSRDERCMAIAYVAKFNSGCISRQVGCAIVDAGYAVQSVGWNDPPSGQLPCQLRYMDELCDDAAMDAINKLGERKYNYFSKFEIEDQTYYEKRKEKGFRSCLKLELKTTTLDELNKNGLRYPFCFRSRYNSYKGQKDQVNTRSLHAEENTMLRIAKMGGIGLQGGTMYVTASPCVLCSKKAYQIGISEIVYLDPYTDIAPDLIIHCGWNSPVLKPFMGAIGGTFYKLYQPFLPYKDELAIWDK